MDRYTAGRIEGMLLASRVQLEGICDLIRENSPKRKQHGLILRIATAIAELLETSREIYKEHPRLNPYLEFEKISKQHYAELKRQRQAKVRTKRRKH